MRQWDPYFKRHIPKPARLDGRFIQNLGGVGDLHGKVYLVEPPPPPQPPSLRYTETLQGLENDMMDELLRIRQERYDEYFLRESRQPVSIRSSLGKASSLIKEEDVFGEPAYPEWSQPKLLKSRQPLSVRSSLGKVSSLIKEEDVFGEPAYPEWSQPKVLSIIEESKEGVGSLHNYLA